MPPLKISRASLLEFGKMCDQSIRIHILVTYVVWYLFVATRGIAGRVLYERITERN